MAHSCFALFEKWYLFKNLLKTTVLVPYHDPDDVELLFVQSQWITINSDPTPPQLQAHPKPLINVCQPRVYKRDSQYINT